MRPDPQQQGFGLVAAMFLIVIIAAVIVVMARLATTQNATSNMSLQQARAYQAAQAGLEWGINRAVSGQACAGNFAFEGFAVVVACVPSNVGVIAEENKNVQFRQITSTAQFGVVNGDDYAYRQLTAVVELP